MTDRIEEAARQRLSSAVEHVATRLERAARDIRLEAARNMQTAGEDKRPDYAGYTYVAENVTRAAVWALANANLDNLASAAGDAETAYWTARQSDGSEAVMVALLTVISEAQGWAEGSHGSQVDMGSRNIKTADYQEFVLSDIKRMVQGAARTLGLPDPLA